MADEIYEGAVNDLTDMSEFTEPTEDAETGAEVEETSETQETAEPAELADEQAEPADEQDEETEEDIPQGKRSRDSAFAEMRRAREEAERQNSELQERLEALERAQREAELRSYAESIGLSEDEIEQVVADADAALDVHVERLGDASDHRHELRDVRVRERRAVQLLQAVLKGLGLENLQTPLPVEAGQNVDDRGRAHAVAQDGGNRDSALGIKAKRERAEKGTDLRRLLSDLLLP